MSIHRLDTKQKAPEGAFIFHFLKSNDRWLTFKYCEILSNVIIIDLQKIHFAPKGFLSETSKDDVLY